MKYWITVSRGEYLVGSEPVAVTASPDLVRQVLVGLCTNRTLEADGLDRVVPDFDAFAREVIAALGETIRAEARLLGHDETEPHSRESGVPAHREWVGGTGPDE